MATPKGSTPEQSFRVLVNRIANDLTPQNCSSLKFLYNINTESKEADMLGLEIMKELLSQDRFSHLQPDTLEDCMSEINRQDLVNLVRKYKKSDEFKLVQKQDNKKVGRKLGRNRTNDEQKVTEKGCGHTLSFILMHTAQMVGQTKYFLEVMTKDVEQQLRKKEIVAAISDAKKDFVRLGKSLNKAISVTAEPHSTKAQLVLSAPPTEVPKPLPFNPKPIPLPKPGGRNRPLSNSATQPNQSSLSGALILNTCSRIQEKSEEDTLIAAKTRTITYRKRSCTGDSGYSGDSWVPSSSLPTARSNDWKMQLGTGLAETEEEPEQNYDTPKVTLYKALNADSMDEPHHYANT